MCRFDEAKRLLVDGMSALPVGNPADPKPGVGPLVSQKQHERVQSHMRKGIEDGAEVIIDGEGRPFGFEAGYFVKSTVLSRLRN